MLPFRLNLVVLIMIMIIIITTTAFSNNIIIIIAFGRYGSIGRMQELSRRPDKSIQQHHHDDGL